MRPLPLKLLPRPRRTHGLTAAVAVLVLTLGAAVVPAMADSGDDPWVDGVRWRLQDRPFLWNGDRSVLAWSAADAGPTGTVIAEVVSRYQPELGPLLLLGVQGPDGDQPMTHPYTDSPVATMVITAADEQTGDAAVVYWDDRTDVGGDIDGAMRLLTYDGESAAWSAEREVAVPGGDAPATDLLPGLVVEDGRVHLAVTAADRLDVYSTDLAGADFTRHTLDTGLDPSHYAIGSLSWDGLTAPANVAPRMDAAPDGSVHVAWVSPNHPDGPGDGEVAVLTASTADGTAWGTPAALTPLQPSTPPDTWDPVGSPSVELLHGPDALRAVVAGTGGTQSVGLSDAGPGAAVTIPEGWRPLRGDESTLRADALHTGTHVVLPDAGEPGGITAVPVPAFASQLYGFVSLGRVGESYWFATGDSMCSSVAAGPCAARWDPTSESWADQGVVHHAFGLGAVFVADIGSIAGAAVLTKVPVDVELGLEPEEERWGLQVARRVVPGATVTATHTVTDTTTVAPTITPTVTDTVTETVAPTATTTVSTTVTASPTSTPTVTVTAPAAPAPTVTVTTTAPPVTAGGADGTARPRPVTGLRARTKRNGDVVVRWSPGAATGTRAVDGYTVRVKGTKKTRVLESRTRTRWVHRSAKDGKRYGYVVRATNDSGASKARTVRHRA